MRRHLQQIGGKLVGFWPLTILATIVYLLTLDHSASWWDCGEFITTSYLLEVGHPPGAPFYQLLAHLFTLLSMGNPMLVAPLSNALSAVAGGFTVGLLYLTVLQLSPFHRRGAAIGALCYLFCDTAWFSAVESEVYALAMLFCAADVYIALLWRRSGDARLPLLLALLLGLGLCVHMMTLLVLPAMLLIFTVGKGWRRLTVRSTAALVLFFVLGLSPYLIVPIRAAANPPINEMGESFGSYLRREQYAKAPLYPRMWRDRDAANWREWNLGADGLVGNVVYYVSYQLGYMYGRYLMYNFGGRENLKWHIPVLFILPALLGIYGLVRHRRRDRLGYWTVMLLFLFGGVVLNFYLNHPCYEPRSRDYVYVLSFYAFALWIGIGSGEWAAGAKRWKHAVLWLAPLVMAVGNWSDHDRHALHAVHDISMAHLQSCDPDAVLITMGDNDTFPLWYLQQVEHQRTDVSIYNIGLTGYWNTMHIINSNLGQRPVYVTQYFYDRYAQLFPGRLRCEGLCWRLLPEGMDINDMEPLRRHANDSIQWNIESDEYLNRVSRGLLRSWQKNTQSLPDATRPPVSL